MGEVVGRTFTKTVTLLALVALAISTIAVAGASPAQAQAANTWRQTPDDTWMTNGTVFDTQLSEDGRTLYVGGRFTVVRENPPGTPGANVSARNLAAIDVASGNLIRTWNPRVEGNNPVVRELAVANGKVYVGGNFTSVNGDPRSNLAAVSATNGTLDPNLRPVVTRRDSALPVVFAMETDGSRLYVGGRFQEINGNNRPQLAAFDLVSGALDNSWKPKSTREVYDLDLAADGATIFVAGRFSGITGSDNVYAQRRNVARLDRVTGNVHPWSIPAGVIGEQYQTSHDLLATENVLYAGFGDKGPNYAAAFRLNNGNDGSQIWRRNTAGDVQALALSTDGSRLFFGGHFGVNAGRQSFCTPSQPVQGLFSLNPATGDPYCDWNPRLQPEFRNGNGTWDISPVGNRVWVGGGFTRVAGISQTNLARFTYGSVTPGSADHAPRITSVRDQRIKKNSATGLLKFSVSDPDSGPVSLKVRVKSSNEALIPSNRIKLKGSKANRTVRLVPIPKRVGRSVITLTVVDSTGRKDTSTFVVTVTR